MACPLLLGSCAIELESASRGSVSVERGRACHHRPARRATRAPHRGAGDVDLLSLLYLVFKQVQQSGVMSLETHFEDPAKSPILSRYPKFLARHDAVDFLADSAKVIIVGGIAAHDLEALMDEDLQVHHHEALRPSSALAKIGDALPGLGIVAAVLGVVITMGHIDARNRRISIVVQNGA